MFVFEVGPSVKFISAIKDAIFKKNGSNFIPVMKTKPGGEEAQWARMWSN